MIERLTIWRLRYILPGRLVVSRVTYQREQLGVAFIEGPFWHRETWIQNHGPQNWKRRIANRQAGGAPFGFPKG